jgi:hypothetical protein
MNADEIRQHTLEQPRVLTHNDCGGILSVVDLHATYYPEPDMCCDIYGCNKCDATFNQCRTADWEDVSFQ